LWRFEKLYRIKKILILIFDKCIKFLHYYWLLIYNKIIKIISLVLGRYIPIYYFFFSLFRIPVFFEIPITYLYPICYQKINFINTWVTIYFNYQQFSYNFRILFINYDLWNWFLEKCKPMKMVYWNSLSKTLCFAMSSLKSIINILY